MGNTKNIDPPHLQIPVHPHERGEYSRGLSVKINLLGSSPRTWGILPGLSENGGCGRFIPTNVGNTGRPRMTRTGHAVHPHERGEYLRFFNVDKGIAGSSPRTWGIRDAGSVSKYYNRFIPTNVGNTRRVRFLCCRCAVHPHERGEYSGHDFFELGRDGSSPRTWGIRSGRLVGSVGTRFIPTNVGNTSFGSPLSGKAAVHPHERGEYQDGLNFLRIDGGSSPRTWGIRPGPRGPRYASRFIPTNVGNTQNNITQKIEVAGSSPRTWGIRECPFVSKWK